MGHRQRDIARQMSNNSIYYRSKPTREIAVASNRCGVPENPMGKCAGGAKKKIELNGVIPVLKPA